jgi:protein-disulfide isomerase
VTINLTTAANAATIAACLLVAAATAPTLRDLWSGSPQAGNGRSATIEHVDFRTPFPKTNLRGDPRAKVVVLEFSDFQCPFCGKYARETFPEIQKEYIDTGRVTYGYRHFPLEGHPLALDAAKAAHCAGEQEQFWRMHDLLFDHQNALALPDLMGYADQLEQLERPRYDACMKAPAAVLDDDMAEGRRLGIKGTPTFLVGTVELGGEVRVLSKINGAQEFRTFSDTIREALVKVSSHS